MQKQTEHKNQITLDSNNTMSILSYVGILWLIPFFSTKKDDFLNFHLKQGAVLLAIEVALFVLESVFWRMGGLISLGFLVTLVFSVMGIMNVLQNKKVELPLIGHLSSFFNIK
jgi:uncharacterized membrane protein